MNTINSVNEHERSEGRERSECCDCKEHRDRRELSALHAAEELLKQREAELGELRRRVGELESFSMDLRTSMDAGFTPDPRWVVEQMMHVITTQLLASDGGADGDNEGEGK